MNAWMNKSRGTTRNNRSINFSAQERSRAEEAVKFHKTSGHIRDPPMYEGLDHGIYNTHLTSRDMTNAVTLYGKCLGYIAGEMKADSLNQTT